MDKALAKLARRFYDTLAAPADQRVTKFIKKLSNRT
jgi:hypothetical protein